MEKKEIDAGHPNPVIFAYFSLCLFTHPHEIILPILDARTDKELDTALENFEQYARIDLVRDLKEYYLESANILYVLSRAIPF